MDLEQKEEFDPEFASADAYRAEIERTNREYVLKTFKLEEYFNFTQIHRVEVLMQSDYQYHCFIDWHLHKNGAWGIDFDPLTAITKGIENYKKHAGKEKV